MDQSSSASYWTERSSATIPVCPRETKPNYRSCSGLCWSMSVNSPPRILLI
ncbi:hypothetical protein cypCar_00043139 [Cyprinus carpio]|nr:hypothetical protein cypCar_00043139 [Cyprinus carpio]